jgi:HAD superfamily hydrolase (TIGR01450 family)
MSTSWQWSRSLSLNVQMPAVTARSALDGLENASGILLDWDGCVAVSDRPTVRAIQFIQERIAKIAIVSNNSTNLPEDFAHILARSGIQIDPRRIILAGVEALKRAVELEPRSVLVLGDSRIKAYARALGLAIAHDNADLVVLLRDKRFSYSRLQRAVNSLRGGARLIVANPDVTHPGARGMVVPETGALHAALSVCLEGVAVETEVIGKPASRLFERACHVLGIEPQAAVMIGDNPATDIAGANAMNMQSILIGARSAIRLGDLVTDRAEHHSATRKRPSKMKATSVRNA